MVGELCAWWWGAGVGGVVMGVGGVGAVANGAIVGVVGVGGHDVILLMVKWAIINR